MIISSFVPFWAKDLSSVVVLSQGFEFWRHVEQRFRVLMGFWATGSSFGAILQRIRAVMAFWVQGSRFGYILCKGFNFWFHFVQKVWVLTSFWAQGSSLGTIFGRKVRVLVAILSKGFSKREDNHYPGVPVRSPDALGSRESRTLWSKWQLEESKVLTLMLWGVKSLEPCAPNVSWRGHKYEPWFSEESKVSNPLLKNAAGGVKSTNPDALRSQKSRTLCSKRQLEGSKVRTLMLWGCSQYDLRRSEEIWDDLRRSETIWGDLRRSGYGNLPRAPAPPYSLRSSSESFSSSHTPTGWVGG